MTLRLRHLPPCGRAFSLLEVLVSLVILTTGIVAIATFFPMSLRQNQRTTDISIAAFLAQMKAEELRRDGNATQDLLFAIQNLTVPTDPRQFPLDPRFSYSFSGVSLLDPLDNPGIARVLVRYDAGFRPDPSEQTVLYELKFDFKRP